MLCNNPAKSEGQYGPDSLVLVTVSLEIDFSGTNEVPCWNRYGIKKGSMNQANILTSLIKMGKVKVV